MAKVFEFSSVEDLKNKVQSKDLQLTIEVYTQIRKAIYSKMKRKKVKAFVAKVGSRNVLEFVLERDQWGTSLNTCMDVFAKNDMFEECIEIQKMLKEL
jgi:hypothetical protein